MKLVVVTGTWTGHATWYETDFETGNTFLIFGIETANGLGLISVWITGWVTITGADGGGVYIGVDLISGEVIIPTFTLTEKEKEDLINTNKKVNINWRIII